MFLIPALLPLPLPNKKKRIVLLDSMDILLHVRISEYKRAVVAVIVWQLDLQLPVQSMPITTKVVSSNPVHGEVYSVQHYVIKFVSDLRQVSSFLRVLRYPPPIKLSATI